jgi:hypothetical protein
LYGEAFSIAEGKGDDAQASYNGINYAFMVLALDKDREGARKIAGAVLTHTAAATTDLWRRATQGEAYLYLGDVPSALLAYADAVKQTWDSRELQSMQRQAIWAARLIDDPHAEAELQSLFQKQLGE